MVSEKAATPDLESKFIDIAAEAQRISDCCHEESRITFADAVDATADLSPQVGKRTNLLYAVKYCYARLQPGDAPSNLDGPGFARITVDYYGMTAPQGVQRFAQAAAGKDPIGSKGLDRIDQHNIKVTFEPAVLKAVIEYDYGVGQCLLDPSACPKSVRGNAQPDRWNVGTNEGRLVAQDNCRPCHDCARREDQYAGGTTASVAAAQEDRRFPQAPYKLRYVYHKGGLAAAAEGEIPNADDGAVQTADRKHTVVVKAVAGTDNRFPQDAEHEEKWHR